ncbi:MAG: hypothetical protein WAX85_02055 [Minisyncoccia bacterium]
MSLNNLPKREEYLRKKKIRKQLKFGVALFIFIIFIAGLSYISHQQKIRISKIELSGGILVTQSEVEYESLTYMYGSYLWLFPKNNSFLYPRSSLEEHLKEKFKRIDTIDIHKKDLQTLVINITERKPIATWCDFLPDDNTLMEDGVTHPVNCYFMDQNSTIFAIAPQFSGDAYFKYYGLIATSTPIGNQYMSSQEKFTDVVNFIEKVKLIKLKPSYLVAKENDQFSLVLTSGTEIYFDMKEPLLKVAENLEVLLRIPELIGMTSNKVSVKYIDLRYGNKLFYKLR